MENCYTKCFRIGMICSYKSWTSLIDIQRNTSLIWNKNTILSKFCSIFNVQIVQNSYYISCSFKSLHCLGCCCTNDQNQLTWVNIVSLLILDCQKSAVTKANPVCGVSWLLLVFPVKTLNKVLVCGCGGWSKAKTLPVPDNSTLRCPDGSS